jgi:hypothetical protein
MLAWDQVVEQIPPIAVLKTQDRKKGKSSFALSA